MLKVTRRIGTAGLTGVVAVALCAGVGATTAFGATRTVDYNEDVASWNIPTTPMTNTVWKDADGNVVDEGTEGATQYKVLTTWAEAWSTSGSDYLGMSNSAFYGNGGNGNATVLTLDKASKQTTVGVWATDANVNPNAYNWNTFYNLYAQNMGYDAEDYSDWGSITSGSNKSPDGGANWSTEAGVWCGFKYRPDVVTTNNNLSAAAAATYIGYIQNGQYAADSISSGSTLAPDASVAPDGYAIVSMSGTHVADVNGDVLCIPGNDGTVTYSTTTSGQGMQAVTTYNYTDNGDGTADFETKEGYIVLAVLSESKDRSGNVTYAPGSIYEIQDADGATISKAATAGEYDQSYAVYGDANYDPEIVSYNNNTMYSFGNSLYTLAAAGEEVIEDTADYAGLDDNEALTWKTVNKLPRSGRYTETPTECALNYEKLVKGAAFYTLSQIDQGNVQKKKVAYINTEFGGSSVEEGTVIVAVMDYVEGIGGGPVDGQAGYSTLAVDQLTTDTKSGAKQGTSMSYSSSDNSTASFQLYVATADDLATCDAIYMPESTKTAAQWQAWIEQYATTDEAKAAAENITYVVNGMPCATNGSNMTIEKTLYPTMALDCIYPELFPNMELSTYWCDAIYHINSSSLTSAMQWIYHQSPLAEGTSLDNLGKDYNRADVLAKFTEGYQYFQTSKNTDATISRILANEPLDGVEIEGGYHFNAFEPSEAWVASETGSYVSNPADQTVGVGDTATFSVSALGEVSSYQWKYSTDGTKWNNVTIAGAKTADLAIAATAAKDGRQFKCVVTFADGQVIESEAATLNVIANEITTQPADASAAQGTTATFTVAATNAASYQWQYSKDGSTWNKVTTASATTDTLEVAATATKSGRQYRCVVTFNNGTKATSDAATLTVAANAITSQPAAATVSAGQTATFSVEATNAASYQWYYSKNGTTWYKVTTASATSADLKVAATAAKSGRQYRCTVTFENGATMKSSAAALTVE